ncbi:MAG: alpha/beta hydrolase [Candidatus Micrarchaeaceae archaeon]
MPIQRVFIIHGTNGSSKENWFPWLKEELSKANPDMEVIVPDLPTGNAQSIESWLRVFQPYMDMITEDTVFIGHSLGPAFILSILEQVDKRIRAAFLVAPFVTKLGIEQFDKLNKTFIEKRFDWERIRPHCSKFTIYASDNNPYVSMNKSRYVAENTKARFIVVHNAGHFNSAAGYTKFEQLLEEVKKEE